MVKADSGNLVAVNLVTEEHASSSHGAVATAFFLPR